MPAINISNYPELLAASADWLNRQDLVDQIPAFVMLSTAQFNREFRFRDMMVRAEATSAEEFVELPSDWLEHYSLVLASGGPPLRYVSERESNDIKGISGGVSGPVGAYTLIGNSIELIPSPGADVDLKMVYYQRIPNLSDLAPNNWLLTKSPDLYLYSTLMQAAPYLKDDQRLTTWAQLRTAIAETMRMESEAALRPRSQLIARARAF